MPGGLMQLVAYGSQDVYLTAFEPYKYKDYISLVEIYMNKLYNESKIPLHKEMNNIICSYIPYSYSTNYAKYIFRGYITLLEIYMNELYNEGKMPLNKDMNNIICSYIQYVDLDYSKELLYINK